MTTKLTRLSRHSCSHSAPACWINWQSARCTVSRAEASADHYGERKIPPSSAYRARSGIALDAVKPELSLVDAALSRIEAGTYASASTAAWRFPGPAACGT